MRRLLVVTLLLSLSASGLPAQEKPAQTSIFDFGGFNDPPEAGPANKRDRKVPTAKPAPGVIEPPPPSSPAVPPVAKPPQPTTPKPSTPAPKPTVGPVAPTPPSVPALPPVSVPPSASDSVVRFLPVPSEFEITKAATAMRQALAVELNAATTKPLHRGLAVRLLRSAADPGLPPASKWVRLIEARDQAASAGDVTLCWTAAQTLLAIFDADFQAISAQSLIQAAPAVTTIPDAHALASRATQLLDGLTAEESFDLAEKLLVVAEPAALKAAPRDALLSGQLRTLAADMRWARQEFSTAKNAIAEVRKGTTDAANLGVAGRYLCLARADWIGGLPLLARSNDPKLREPAASDLAAPPRPEGQALLASQWWEAASGEQPVPRAALMQRAAFWYRMALPNLPAAVQPQAEQRIGQAAAALRRVEPGIVAEIFADPGLRYRQRVRIETDVATDFSKTSPDPTVDPSIFGIRWSGILKAPRSGTYSFSVKVQESARVWLDGALILSADSPKGTATVSLPVTEGLHDLRVHYNSRGSKSSIRLNWTVPGLYSDQPIQPQYFFHDARAGAEYGTGATLLPHGALDRTPRVGGGGGGWYEELPSDADALLVGFRVTSGGGFGTPVVRSIQPVFRTSWGELEEGPRRGAGGKNEQSAIAKDGYAVGMLAVKGGARLDGFVVTFMKVRPDGTLDPKDAYESERLGGPGGNGPTILAGDGRPVVGICGRCAADVDSLGLIQKLQLANQPNQIVSAKWGREGKMVDVTQRVRILAYRKGEKTKVTPKTMEIDPVPGKGKHLEINIIRDGRKETITIHEGDALIIPGISG